jgi:hypothetical protein
MLIEQTLPNLPAKADTHLNLAAVLSQLGRHDLALSNAQTALVLIQGSLLRTLIPQNAKSTLPDGIKERVSVLVIAYHNLAVEQEFLKMVRFMVFNVVVS